MEDLAENEGGPRSAFRRQCDGVLPTDQQLVVLETVIDRIRTEAAEEQESRLLAWIREVFEDVVGWQMGVQAAQAGGEIVFVDADGSSVARDPKRLSATFQLLRWKLMKSLSEIPALDMPRLCNVFCCTTKSADLGNDCNTASCPRWCHGRTAACCF